jgi:3-methyl-2-oxobutanoate hydroxymethyltransferase
MSDEKTQPKRKKVTIPMLQEKMRQGEPITQMAVYEYRHSVICDRLGMDIQCVSDSGAMILFGHKSTVTVTFEEVMIMAKAIQRGCQYGLKMVDMPYWSFHVSPEQAVENAGRFVHEAEAEVMKCEGNQRHAKAMEAIVNAGIPVQGHIGITPMRMPQLGGFRAQGKTADDAKRLIDDAQAMVDAGCFSIMCEVVSSEVTQYLAETLPVPVISLGSGNKAHGVHIIASDLFKLHEEHVPRHARVYTDLIPIIEDVYSRYMTDVQKRDYPGPENTVFMKDEERERFAKTMNWKPGK